MKFYFSLVFFTPCDRVRAADYEHLFLVSANASIQSKNMEYCDDIILFEKYAKIFISLFGFASENIFSDIVRGLKIESCPNNLRDTQQRSAE